MKTRDELIEKARDYYRLNEHKFKTVTQHMADFALSLDEETCKWKRLTPKQGGNWEATCQEDVITFSNIIVQDYFKFCPFCGRKIERI